LLPFVGNGGRRASTRTFALRGFWTIVSDFAELGGQIQNSHSTARSFGWRRPDENSTATLEIDSGDSLSVLARESDAR
jgi:hypothetical protein